MNAPPLIVAGLGLRPNGTAEEIIALIHKAAQCAGVMPTQIAVPWIRASTPAVHQAARHLNLPIWSVTPGALLHAQPRCHTFSMRARTTLGLGSIAEGCALAAVGPRAILCLPRIASAAVTCALAMRSAHASLGRTPEGSSP